jgi:hypothetical protein
MRCLSVTHIVQNGIALYNEAARRIEYDLWRLTLLVRCNPLTGLERLEVCGTDIPASATILQELRTEFRQDRRPAIAAPAHERQIMPDLRPFVPVADRC